MGAEEEQPFVSVVMPVHNAMPHLDEAVRSILDQTYRNFEFVILDDASTDGSTQRLHEWKEKDSRIRLFEQKRNLGPVGSSNFVVERSKAELVARMDADDVCDSNRLMKQVQVLREHPEAGLVASLFEIIDEDGKLLRGPEYWRVMRRSGFVPFGHGSIMFRRSVFDRIQGYRTVAQFWEDQDLVVRVASVADVLIIPEAHLKGRQWTKNTRVVSDRAEIENQVDLMYRSVGRLEQNQTYDDLLEGNWRPERVDPRVFIASGSLLLWAGRRPRLFGRLIKRGQIGLNARSLAALVWTAWASCSPRTLRGFLQMLLRVRNARAKPIPPNTALIRWSPNSQATITRRGDT